MLKRLVMNSLYFGLLALTVGVGIIFMMNNLDTSTSQDIPSENTAIVREEEERTSIEVPEQIHTNNQEEKIITKKQLDVPLIQQLPELPRGCEVTSLAMILQYNGVSVDKMELSEKITYVPFQKNGLYGNMHNGFVGNMTTFEENGLGVYIDPIIQLAELYVDSNRIVNLTGESTDQLYKAVKEGHPVWVITNSWFSKLPDEEFLNWTTEEGSMKVTYRQHSVVITDYDNEFVYVNDPLQDKKNVPINRGDFEAAWVQMNKQAMYITS
ncbi:C39 family peptidase [Bacillus massiliigorillae]|uniref:C39 family peptidase n=1 Tax=Bacillus massiliigorillae TaxID=1243664 RepID=UPI0003A614FE|nr:C39 family peptidase [Bacillus massiliigorillae]